MLTKRHSPYVGGNPRARQSGVVLLITLIVLVAMTLTAIALVRSMDTTNVIAGNLAFQQSATQSSDTGVEAAIFWMENNNAILANDNSMNGYSSSFHNPGDVGYGSTWDEYFTTSLNGKTYTIQENAVGNTVTYAIERLCAQANILPNTINAGCTVAPLLTLASAAHVAGQIPLTSSTQQYYRITSRTVGPHHARSYVQAIIAM